MNRLGHVRSKAGIDRIRTQRSGEILPLSRLNVNVFRGVSRTHPRAPPLSGRGALLERLSLFEELSLPLPALSESRAAGGVKWDKGEVGGGSR
jgi:hypothetical protein